MTENKEYNTVEFNDISGKPEGVYSENEETHNNEPVIEELESISNPWDNAPKDCYFYERISEDGRIEGFTANAELAYKIGLDIEHNYIWIRDTQQSDINGWTYRKDLCPMKTEQDLLKDQYRLEINQLKKQLSDTDYKAIKYAEGQISEEDYLPIKNQRAEWRAKINQLQEDFNI